MLQAATGTKIQAWKMIFLAVSRPVLVKLVSAEVEVKGFATCLLSKGVRLPAERIRETPRTTIHELENHTVVRISIARTELDLHVSRFRMEHVLASECFRTQHRLHGFHTGRYAAVLSPDPRCLLRRVRVLTRIYPQQQILSNLRAARVLKDKSPADTLLWRQEEKVPSVVHPQTRSLRSDLLCVLVEIEMRSIANVVFVSTLSNVDTV
mmetsp:Transcript_1510/g.4136  ORF Transcript_1510/g.4136 Transcript_1510/m.4136 type:complete len:209 (+) Transcript_1510:125-751(+)